MEFNYWQTFRNSMSLLSKNLNLFFGVVILTGISSLPRLGLDQMANDPSLVGVAAILSLLVAGFSIFASIYGYAAMWNSIKVIVSNQKLSLLDYFRNGINRFGAYAAFVGLMIGIYFVFQIVLVLLVAIGTIGFLFGNELFIYLSAGLVSCAVLIAAFYLFSKLIFMLPAIGSGQGAMQALNSSWKFYDRNHQLRCTWVIILANILGFLPSGILLFNFFVDSFRAGIQDAAPPQLSVAMYAGVFFTGLIAQYVAISSNIFLEKAYMSKLNK